MQKLNTGHPREKLLMQEAHTCSGFPKISEACPANVRALSPGQRLSAGDIQRTESLKKGLRLFLHSRGIQGSLPLCFPSRGLERGSGDTHRGIFTRDRFGGA